MIGYQLLIITYGLSLFQKYHNISRYYRLVLYFRHIAQKGDIIMIDEPELNLHPDSQLIVTRLFAKAVNKGFQVLSSLSRRSPTLRIWGEKKVIKIPEI